MLLNYTFIAAESEEIEQNISRLKYSEKEILISNKKFFNKFFS